MKIFRKKDRDLYLVLAYWARPKVGEIQTFQPLIRGMYRNIEKAKQCVKELESMHMYSYVTFVSIPTDL